MSNGYAGLTMELALPNDFKEFLRLLNENRVEYLLIGGYAVSFHGYPRATGDLDIWVAISPTNAGNVVAALRQFGFDIPEVTDDLFLQPWGIVRMGHPPMRVEVTTTIDGVDFAECYLARVSAVIDGVEVEVISLPDLKRNKLASGRAKDLADLEQLP
jgi:predicted nucleotidyltransferase